MFDRGGAARQGKARQGKARQGKGSRCRAPMKQTEHRSVQQAASYYKEAEGGQDRAARLYDAVN
jgi:hypothetical protein